MKEGYYRRIDPGPGETLRAGLAAGAIAAAAAAVSFYLVRVYLARERLEPPGADTLEEEAFDEPDEDGV